MRNLILIPLLMTLIFTSACTSRLIDPAPVGTPHGDPIASGFSRVEPARWISFLPLPGNASG